MTLDVVRVDQTSECCDYSTCYWRFYMMSALSMVGSHIYYAATHGLDSDQLVNVHVNISDIGYCTS